MGFRQKLVEQVRKPSGRLGRIIAKGMNKGHAKLAIWGLSHLKIDPNDIVLDIGCGGGGNIERYAKMVLNGKIYGIDYSKTAVYISKEINRRYINQGIVEIYEGSISSLPFLDNFFNLVSSFETFYFWSDLTRDLKEIYRVLKPNGHLILVNEGYKCDNKKRRQKAEKWSKLGNFPIHTPEEYKEFLEQAGFSDIQISEEYKKGWISAIGMKKL